MKMEFVSATLSTAGSTGYEFCVSHSEFLVFLRLHDGTSSHHQQHAHMLLEEIKKSLHTTPRTFQSVHAIVERMKKDKTIFSSVLVVLEKDILYAGSVGEGVVLLKRDGKCALVLSPGEAISGRVKTGDMFFIGMKTIRDIILGDALELLVNVKEIDEAIKKLQSLETKEDARETIIVAGIHSGMEKFTAGKWKEQILRMWESIRAKRKIQFNITSNVQKLSKGKKILLVVVTLLSCILLTSIVTGILKMRQAQSHKRLLEVFDLVSQQYEEGSNLIDLNPIRARELLVNAKLTLTPYLRTFSKQSKEYKDVSNWINKISSQEVVAYRIFKLTAAPIFFDIGLIRQQGEGVKVAMYKDTMVILDVKNKAVYKLSAETKKAQIIAGGDVVKDTKSISVHGETAYLFQSEGIVSIDLESKTAKVIIPKDGKWGEIVDIASFGGNLYLLDRTNNTIHKYIATDFGFSDRQSYLNPDVRVDFAKATSMNIDGSIWVNMGVGVEKFGRGLQEQFSFKGISDTLSDVQAISVNEDNKNIYVLEKETKRILVFDKDGVYQSQYQWDELGKANDIVALENMKKTFVLVGSKIYSIELQ